MLGNRWNMRLTDREVIRAIARLERPCSQEEIADMLGCHRHTVMRSIRRLSKVIIPQGSGSGRPFTYAIVFDLLPDDLRRELGCNGNRDHSHSL